LIYTVKKMRGFLEMGKEAFKAESKQEKLLL
jgi:hypothetical protein